MMITIVVLSIVILALVASNVVLWVALTNIAGQVASIEVEELKTEKVELLITKTNRRISKVVRVQHEFMNHVTSELKKAGLMK